MPGEQTSPVPDSHRRRTLISLASAVVVLAMVAAALLLWRSWRSAPAHAPLAGTTQGFNILLITLDTVRADHLGCYGHPSIETPNMDMLAKDGIAFSQCVSCVPLTLPSHASILLSTYPYVHGARMNGWRLADDGNLSLAEQLKSAGYATGAEVGAFVLSRSWGLDQGFDSYRSEGDGFGAGAPSPEHGDSVPAEDVCERALDWLKRHGSSAFFLWVHFYDPHLPWNPPEPFRGKYPDDRFGDYLAEITYVDAQVGRLLGALRDMGVMDRTLIVLTADHGEGLLDHDELAHDYFIYDSTMHVPLIFYCPARLPGGRWIDRQVRTVDIAPTILVLVGVPPLGQAQGASLLPLMANDDDTAVGPAYSECVNPFEAYGYAKLRGLRADGWKYIHAPIPELYDLTHDEGETRNVAQQYPQRVAAMREALADLLADSSAPRPGPGPSAQLNPEEAERLASLGYIGGTTTASDADEALLPSELEGPDPKDHIKLHNEFIRAQAWAGMGRPDQVEPIVREILAAEPRNPAVLMFWADYLRRLSRHAEAAQHYAVLLQIRPENGLAHYHGGCVLAELGRFDEATAHLRRAVELLPDYPDAHAYLGLAYVRVGKPANATECFRRAAQLAPGNERYWLALSRTLHAQARFDEVVQTLRTGLQNCPDSLSLTERLAWRLATLPSDDLRNGDEAVALVEGMLQRVPRPDPYILNTLAAACAEAGRFDEAIDATTRALAMAQSANDRQLVQQLQMRLSLYRSHRPCRE